MDTYSDLLENAERALSRLRALGQQFPADIPADFLRQLERAHADPAGERRFAVRLAGERDRLVVRLGVGTGRAVEAQVLDQCVGGVRVRLGCPVGPGAVLAVRSPGEAAWRAAEVRHCRRSGGGVGGRVPIRRQVAVRRDNRQDRQCEAGRTRTFHFPALANWYE
jgi:hypothetical protein